MAATLAVVLTLFCSGGYAFADHLDNDLMKAAFFDGLAAYDRGDSATALKLWRPYADEGWADFQINLGLMYKNGEGVPQNDKTAVSWYLRAAGSGHPAAQDDLAFMYYEGRGVPKNYVEAYMWWSLAKEGGNKQAAEYLDHVGEQMTSAQINEAKNRAEEEADWISSWGKRWLEERGH
jgi:hypothetical protein